MQLLAFFAKVRLQKSPMYPLPSLQARLAEGGQPHANCESLLSNYLDCSWIVVSTCGFRVIWLSDWWIGDCVLAKGNLQSFSQKERDCFQSINLLLGTSYVGLGPFDTPCNLCGLEIMAKSSWSLLIEVNLPFPGPTSHWQLVKRCGRCIWFIPGNT